MKWELWTAVGAEEQQFGGGDGEEQENSVRQGGASERGHREKVDRFDSIESNQLEG